MLVKHQIILTERLWHTIKYKAVYLHEYANPKEADHQLANYIRFYNFKPPRQGLSDTYTGLCCEAACSVRGTLNLPDLVETLRISSP